MSKPRSLSLTTYRILSWGGQNGQLQPTSSRPVGELLWIHIATKERLRVVDEFCRRLLPAVPGLSILMTAPPDADLSDWSDCIAPVIPLPKEGRGAARVFLDHWQPDACIWVGGGLMPNLITRAEERGIPMLLLEAGLDLQVAPGGRWLPDLPRYTLDCFKLIMAPNEEIKQQISRLGISAGKVTVSPPLWVDPNPETWPEEELVETNQQLAGRPVWLAAWVQDKEFISVLSAHRQALRTMPRLALVLHVADMDEAMPLHKRLEAMDLRCANWDDGDPVEDLTQVILSSDPADLGLWYRVSPVSFLGSSLQGDAGGCDPMVAAALGSAVVHGPDVRHHAERYVRLAHAGAAQVVRTATQLGDNVVELLAPDRAADMALAGWRVATESAPLVDRLIDTVLEMLEQERASNARA